MTTSRSRRPPTLDRAVKWLRRHRTAVIASTTALLVTLTASTAVLWASKHRTDDLLDKNRAARVEGELAIQQSLGTLDQITRSVLSDSGTLTTGAAQRILPWAIGFYGFIGKEFSGSDHFSQEVLAKAQRQTGFCRLNMGDSRGRQDYRQAIRGFQDLAARFPERLWYRTRLIETLQQYAGLLARRACRRNRRIAPLSPPGCRGSAR